jgi:hypothetical protein
MVVAEGRTVLLRKLKGLRDSAWSTSTTLFVLHKVSWASMARRIKEVR